MKIDIGIVCREKTQFLEDCLKSIYQHVPKDLSEIVIVEQNAPESENFNELLVRAKNEYLIYINDDIEILHTNWLFEMYALMRAGNIGIATCTEVTTHLDAEMFRRHPASFVAPITNMYSAMPWAASYVFGFNRERINSVLTYDEQIPHGWPDPDLGAGMCDLDLSLSVRKLGLNVVKAQRTVVFHKSMFRERSEVVHPEKKEKHLALWKKQREYMLNKWGNFYVESTGHPVQDIT